jgi:hypothetical protein
MSKARPNHLVRPALQVRPTLLGVAGPTLWHVPGPEHPLSCEHNLDEHDSLKNISLIQGWRLGSMGPLVWLINRHNRHSEAILGVAERRRCITRHGSGPTAPRGPAAPIHLRAG